MNRTHSHSHSHSYGYPYQAATGGRYANSHASSSAFSASANANEDWTKISDLAERRRIQNRIAQRNYRKKLKRRLEDLERRAASSSASPEQSHEELDNSHSDHSESSVSSRTLSESSAGTEVTRTMSPEVLTVDSFSSPEERGSLFGQQCTRQLSTSPPPIFSYGSYAFPEQSYQSYPQHTAYHSLPAPYSGDYTYSNQYLPPLTATLPTMPPSTMSMKRDALFPEEDMMTPFSMSYASMAGIDISNSQAFSETNHHTPSLTYSTSSFEHSRSNSPVLSIPALPTPEPSVLL